VPTRGTDPLFRPEGTGVFGLASSRMANNVSHHYERLMMMSLSRDGHIQSIHCRCQCVARTITAPGSLPCHQQRRGRFHSGSGVTGLCDLVLCLLFLLDMPVFDGGFGRGDVFTFGPVSLLSPRTPTNPAARKRTWARCSPDA
jgi:hypothetical protein